MSADLPFQIKKSTNHHAENEGYDDGRKVMWNIKSVKCDGARTITDGGQSIWSEAFFAFSQFLHSFSIEPLVKIDQ